MCEHALFVHVSLDLWPDAIKRHRTQGTHRIRAATHVACRTPSSRLVCLAPTLRFAQLDPLIGLAGVEPPAGGTTSNTVPAMRPRSFHPSSPYNMCTPATPLHSWPWPAKHTRTYTAHTRPLPSAILRARHPHCDPIPLPRLPLTDDFILS